MRWLTIVVCIIINQQWTFAQKFHLFSDEVKNEYPSVVYDFLERYLFEIDSLQNRHIVVDRKLHEDKVVILAGDVSSVRRIKEDNAFSITQVETKYYQVSWSDSSDTKILEVAFPIQYELLLGIPKVEIEKVFMTTLQKYNIYSPKESCFDDMVRQEDGCLMSKYISNYYVESLNTAVYYDSDSKRPTYSNTDKWHSAANLFHGYIEDIDEYILYIEQNLYGFKTIHYSIPLVQWLAYCQAMNLRTYFAIEEEGEDYIKALLIAQSQDLGFNHMLSLILPENFVDKRNAVIKATLNAYIPTQNVKNLYQQYVEKPKKKI